MRRTYAEESRALLRGRVLDATGELLAERAWAEVRMADIASAAGVSRQTLYNEFGGRQELAQAYVLREVEWFLADVESAVLGHTDDARAAIEAAFAVFLRAAAEHPIVRAILAGDGSDGLLELVTTGGGPVIALATDRLRTFLRAAWPQVSERDAQLVAENAVRLAISHAALPSGPPDETAARVAEIFGPHVARLTGG